MTVEFTDNIVDRTIAKYWPPFTGEKPGVHEYNLLVSLCASRSKT